MHDSHCHTGDETTLAAGSGGESTWLRPRMVLWRREARAQRRWKTLVGYRRSRDVWSCRAISSSVGKARSGVDALYSRIKAGGPITVAEYMRECLLHPVTGYYMHKDMFGAKGDFITSPEISQVFGELFAVWVLADWMAAGKPGKCQLVELGPGRGTLASDMIRVFGQFKAFQEVLSLHLVEASPVLSDIQEDRLKGSGRTDTDGGALTTAEAVSGSVPYKSCTLDSGTEAHWYQRTEDVPKGYSYFVAHEFFDAFPMHQFQRTEGGWREVLVDIDPAKGEGGGGEKMALRFVLAPGPTPASAMYASFLPPDGDQAELCPEAMVEVKELACRVREHGGAALVADYGGLGNDRHTLRGFKQHQLHDVLVQPGTADLTADVDFAAFKRAALEEGAGCFGPVTQNEFLHKMGIRQRIDALLSKANSAQAKDLLSSYELLTSRDKMGERFKFLTITSSHTHIPTPFSE